MIVDDLYLIRIPILPAEAHTPLVIDADAVLPLPFAPQSLQSVSWGNPEVLQRTGAMQIQEFPPRHSLNCPKPWNIEIIKQCRCVASGEGPNHGLIVLRITYSIKLAGQTAKPSFAE